MVRPRAEHAGQDVILQNDNQAVKSGHLLSIGMAMSVETDIGPRDKEELAG
jgi:hypothetical protein